MVPQSWVRCLLTLASLLLFTAATISSSAESSAEPPPTSSAERSATDTTLPAIPRSGEVIDVSIANLEVVVTDKRGNRVRGLEREDFEVLENGKPQAITNFVEYGSAARDNIAGDAKVSVENAAAPAAERPEREKRTVVIFIDDFSLPDYQKTPSFEGIKKLLRSVIAPGDQVMVAHWKHRIVMRQPLTGDLARVDAVLDAINRESAGVRLDPSAELRRRQEEVREFVAAIANDVFGNEAAIELETKAYAYSEAYDLKNKMEAVNGLVASLSGFEGKKVMLMLTQRFGRIGGYEHLATTHSRSSATLASGNRYTARDRAGSVPLPPMHTEMDLKDFSASEELKQLTRNANAQGVTIYPLYPEGLRSTWQGSADVAGAPAYQMSARDNRGYDNLVLRNEIEGLTYVARETGGMMAWGGNIDNLLPRIREDFDAYYSLAYRVPAGSGDSVRAVEVRTKNRDHVVRTRREFVDRSPVTKIVDRLRAHLARDPDASHIAVTLERGKAVPAKEKNHWVIPIRVRVPVSALTLISDQGKERGAFSVYVGSARVAGPIPPMTRQTVAFTGAQAAKTAFFAYDFHLLTDLTTHRLSIAVVDEVSQETGFAVMDLGSKDADD